MTDLLSRSADTGDESPARPTVAAATGAVVAAAVGLLACIAVASASWVADGRGSFAGAVRVGADAWLLGHGAGLRTDSATITVLPVGLLLIMAAIVWKAARWVARSAGLGDLRSVLVATATMAGCYTALTTLTAVVAATDEVSASPLRALAGSLLVAAVFGGAGLAGAAGVVGPTVAGWPETLRAVLRGGTAVAVALVGAGALLATTSLVVDFAQAATVAESLDAGVVGGAVFTALQALLLPNAALLSLSYLIGPGFVFGTGSLVAPSGVSLGQLPAVPLLAALPSDGAAPWWAMGLVGVPVLAGAVGAVVALRAFPAASFDAAAVRGGLAGLVGGGAAGLLTALGGGAAGPGRMADIGALVWECAGVAAVAAAIGGAIGGPCAALVHRWWSQR